MLSEAELKRIKKRAEHILTIGKRYGEDSVLYHVLRGDAIDCMSLLEEIEELKRQYAKVRGTDFKIVSQAEIKALLKASETPNDDF